LGSDIN